jgi:hypothetical protein
VNNNSEKKLYMQLHGQHVDALLQASQSYDKAILSLSIASLGFTFAFVRWKNTSIYHTCLLSFIWFFLISAITMILLSFLCDQLHTSHRIEFLNSKIIDESKKIAEKHWTDDWLFILPILSGLLYVVSILLFTIFVNANIY